MVRSTIVASYSLTSGAGVGRLAITKKLVLWSVLVLQVGFIGCIWLLQMSRGQDSLQRSALEIGARVHFVTSSEATKTSSEKIPRVRGTHCPRQQDNVNRYDRDFYQMKTERLNESHLPDYNVPAYVDAEMGLTPALWCYREGTTNESLRINDVDYLMAPPQCKCESGWHGKDCGQPEIIWRALMTSSRPSKRGGSTPLQLVEASSTSLHRLFYMLELGAWDHLSLELLELQIRALIEVVDYFLIYYVSNGNKERSLESMLGSRTSYTLLRCSSESNCSSSMAYSHFRRQLWQQCGVQMQAQDLLLHGDSGTVYSPAALKFLKYYAKDVLPLKFRLKYNVYGFYWQHPKKTLLNGVISSLGHLHNAQLDAHRLHRMASSTLGDLNHYGGWNCELCLPPEQIVLLLQSSTFKKLPVKLPNDTRNAHIDANYMQQLIANGVHIDGTTQLLRLREQSEKYFAPEEALLHSSQYGQLLVNLYDVDILEDLQEED
ncbi:beta-1,4-mannosyl-glycoprotein 4-beta-N-acetylglucosaminyltransferase [Drosophila eugracilis]|uniref:beta-1,4-mannosyl-glycoprotein 4-beta-N-acetylglucosaminyltransferase n=1 Tax=Drosophila eugracilis TaxID=29029 RepID=UPI001BDB1DF7|nr:beta-1,4-mannosyl-glycoprotein 4-beta-N-acetylglucosaminyltransferase [Drosophila eugracilis]